MNENTGSAVFTEVEVIKLGDVHFVQYTACTYKRMYEVYSKSTRKVSVEGKQIHLAKWHFYLVLTYPSSFWLHWNQSFSCCHVPATAADIDTILRTPLELFLKVSWLNCMLYKLKFSLLFLGKSWHRSEAVSFINPEDPLQGVSSPMLPDLWKIFKIVSFYNFILHL